VAQASSRLDEASFPEDTESEITHWFRKDYDSTFDDEDLKAGGPSGDEYGSGEMGSGSIEPPDSSSQSPFSTGECVPGWRSDWGASRDLVERGWLARQVGVPIWFSKGLRNSVPWQKRPDCGTRPLAPRSKSLGSRLVVCRAVEDAGKGWFFQGFSGAEAKAGPTCKTLWQPTGADHPEAWMGRAAGPVCLWKGPRGRFLPVFESVLADGFPSFLLARNGLLAREEEMCSSLFEAFPLLENTKQATFASRIKVSGAGDLPPGSLGLQLPLLPS
ncbi:uncharacterized protein LOC113431047, partial [Notechis scutatus]|uniref:Uncharacterized protein LOC113431047 n=1 Tax=Notechis scutatus TaxID=8663 RepID=A0A6J1W202_9SAUR